MAKKTAEQMNAERRAAKLRQKHGGAKNNKVEGFTFQSANEDRQRRQRAAAFAATRQERDQEIRDQEINNLIEQANRIPVILPKTHPGFPVRFKLFEAASKQSRDLFLDSSGENVILGRRRG